MLNRPYLLPDRYVFPEYPPELPFSTTENGKTEFVIKATVREVSKESAQLDGTTQLGTKVSILISIIAEGIAHIFLEGENHNSERVTLARIGSAETVTSVKEMSNSGLSLRSREITVQINLDPFHVTFLGADGESLLDQNFTHRDATDRLSLLPFGFTEIDGTRIAFHDSFTLNPDEHFYGFGEKFNNFDKRGLRMEMWAHNIYGLHNEQAYKNIPFFLSSNRYGVFVNSVTCTRFDMGASNQAVFSLVIPNSALDYYVIAGPGLLRRSLPATLTW